MHAYYRRVNLDYSCHIWLLVQLHVRLNLGPYRHHSGPRRLCNQAVGASAPHRRRGRSHEHHENPPLAQHPPAAQLAFRNAVMGNARVLGPLQSKHDGTRACAPDLEHS